MTDNSPQKKLPHKFTLTTHADRLALFVGFLALYLFSRTGVHGPAEDAWLMIVDFTKGSLTDLLHPHHLLYGSLAHVWWKLWQAVGMQDAYRVIQTLNSILGALAILHIYILGRELRLSARAAVWAAVASGISFGCWWLSSEIEAAPLSLLAFVLTLRYLWFLHRTRITPVRAVIAAMITIFAVSTHIFHLSLPILALFVIIKGSLTQYQTNKDERVVKNQPNQDIGRVRVRNAFVFSAVYLLSFMVCLLCLYRLADYLSGADMGAVKYMIGYFEPDAVPGFSLRAPFLFVVGLARSLFGIEIMFRLPVVINTVSNIFPNKDFSDEIFLVRGMSPYVVVCLITFMVIVTLGIVVSLFYTIKRLPMLSKVSGTAFVFILAGLVTVSLPVVVTGPILYNSTANNEHLLPFWALWFLCMALAFGKSGGLSKLGRLSAFIMLVLILTTNGLGSIKSMKDPGNDMTITGISPWIESVDEDDIVVLHLTERDAAAFRYLTRASVINTMHENRSNDVALREMAAESGGEVWIQNYNGDTKQKYPLVAELQLERMKKISSSLNE